ncbi:hypothetical protein EJB05_23208, partial [Eragrostis curvula]
MAGRRPPAPSLPSPSSYSAALVAPTAAVVDLAPAAVDSAVMRAAAAAGSAAPPPLGAAPVADLLAPPPPGLAMSAAGAAAGGATTTRAGVAGGAAAADADSGAYAGAGAEALAGAVAQPPPGAAVAVARGAAAGTPSPTAAAAPSRPLLAAAAASAGGAAVVHAPALGQAGNTSLPAHDEFASAQVASPAGQAASVAGQAVSAAGQAAVASVLAQPAAGQAVAASAPGQATAATVLGQSTQAANTWAPTATLLPGPTSSYAFAWMGVPTGFTYVGLGMPPELVTALPPTSSALPPPTDAPARVRAAPPPPDLLVAGACAAAGVRAAPLPPGLFVADARAAAGVWPAPLPPAVTMFTGPSSPEWSNGQGLVRNLYEVSTRTDKITSVCERHQFKAHHRQWIDDEINHWVIKETSSSQVNTEKLVLMVCLPSCNLGRWMFIQRISAVRLVMFLCADRRGPQPTDALLPHLSNQKCSRSHLHPPPPPTPATVGRHRRLLRLLPAVICRGPPPPPPHPCNSGTICWWKSFGRGSLAAAAAVSSGTSCFAGKKRDGQSIPIFILHLTSILLPALAFHLDFPPRNCYA